MFKKIIIIGLLIIPAAFLYAQEPAADDPEKTATVVSEETKPTADRINERRGKEGVSLLKIVEINMVPSQNCRPISTTRIRRGEMDREGRLLKKQPA